uniref:Nuclear pore complex protein Nup153 n=1 Tax=Anopheles dirus TaxID=7168 RepID=A0A182N123_9DIPT
MPSDEEVDTTQPLSSDEEEEDSTVPLASPNSSNATSSPNASSSQNSSFVQKIRPAVAGMFSRLFSMSSKPAVVEEAAPSPPDRPTAQPEPEPEKARKRRRSPDVRVVSPAVGRHEESASPTAPRAETVAVVKRSRQRQNSASTLSIPSSNQPLRCRQPINRSTASLFDRQSIEPDARRVFSRDTSESPSGPPSEAASSSRHSRSTTFLGNANYRAQRERFSGLFSKVGSAAGGRSASGRVRSYPYRLGDRFGGSNRSLPSTGSAGGRIGPEYGGSMFYDGLTQYGGASAARSYATAGVTSVLRPPLQAYEPRAIRHVASADMAARDSLASVTPSFIARCVINTINEFERIKHGPGRITQEEVTRSVEQLMAQRERPRPAAQLPYGELQIPSMLQMLREYKKQANEGELAGATTASAAASSTALDCAAPPPPPPPPPPLAPTPQQPPKLQSTTAVAAAAAAAAAAARPVYPLSAQFGSYDRKDSGGGKQLTKKTRVHAEPVKTGDGMPVAPKLPTLPLPMLIGGPPSFDFAVPIPVFVKKPSEEKANQRVGWHERQAAPSNPFDFADPYVIQYAVVRLVPESVYDGEYVFSDPQPLSKGFQKERPIYGQGEAMAPKSFRALTADQGTKWACEVCLVRNEPALSTCVACGTPKPGPKRPAQGFQELMAAEAVTNKWSCEVCMIRNGPERSACAACETPKPGPKAPAQGFRELMAAEAVTNKWSCEVCMVRNEPERSACAACETPKPGPKAPAQGFREFMAAEAATNNWSCGVCMIRNGPERAACAACETPKPGPKAPAQGFRELMAAEAATNNWSCEVCMIRNGPEKAACAACETPKPAAKNPAPGPVPATTSETGFAALVATQNTRTWTCGKCTAPNEKQFQRCLCCEQDRPATAAPEAAPVPKPTFTFGTLPKPFRLPVPATTKTPPFGNSNGNAINPPPSTVGPGTFLSGASAAPAAPGSPMELGSDSTGDNNSCPSFPASSAPRAPNFAPLAGNNTNDGAMPSSSKQTNVRNTTFGSTFNNNSATGNTNNNDNPFRFAQSLTPNFNFSNSASSFNQPFPNAFNNNNSATGNTTTTTNNDQPFGFAQPLAPKFNFTSGGNLFSSASSVNQTNAPVFRFGGPSQPARNATRDVQIATNPLLGHSRQLQEQDQRRRKRRIRQPHQR